MLRKSITTVLAAASLAVAATTFSASAEARGWHHARPVFRQHVWHPIRHVYRPVYRVWSGPVAHQVCHWRKKWRHHHRVRVRVCRPVYW